MSRIFAIDWDRNEARAILLQSGPTGTSVVGAWAAKLEAPEGAPLNGKQIGERLSQVMGGDAAGKATTIVGVGRDHTQIKLLSLPPSPEDELPELVRFQAEREFNALGTEAALDYIPISGDAEMQHQVLAVALSPAGITEAREAAQAAGAEVTRITVRALAAVSLVERAGALSAGSVSLVVNPLIDEADLAVVNQGKVILLRTVRLPDASQAAGRQRALLGEIRRTIAAARQQAADRPVDQVLICGNSAAVDQAANLGGEEDVTVKMFDPAASAPAGFGSSGVSAEALSRFAAVLGMAQAEVDRRPPIVDFLNVRRKAEARKFGREHTLLAVAAAGLLLLVGGFLWFQNYRLSSQLASIKTSINAKNAETKKLQAVSDQVDTITKWRSTNINWLDELADISAHMRPKTMPRTPTELEAMEGGYPEKLDVMVKQQLVFGRPVDRSNNGGGVITIMQAVAKDQDAASYLEDRFWEDERGLIITTPGGGADTSVPSYTWKADYTITVPPPEDADTPAVPGEPSAAKASAAKPATENAKAAPAEAGKESKQETKAASPAAADKSAKKEAK